MFAKQYNAIVFLSARGLYRCEIQRKRFACRTHASIIMGESDFELYSKRQQVVLAILPYISAPLSGVGSAVIIYVIVRGKRNAKIQTYERLMLGMSTLDFISSFGLVAFG